MLLIWDIHINAKYRDKILTSLRNFIAQQPEEKNLIFLGDFVYHFSYDRTSLLALYDLFLDLYQQGKHLYILAGNHDRLGNSFVFEEAKKAFQVISHLMGGGNERGQWEIHFITQPLLTELEGKSVCFLPYMLDINLADYPWIEEFQDDFYHEHLKTGNKNQTLSAKLHLLLQYYQQVEGGGLTFIHHYYFDGVAFPGQKSKFSFRDVALSSSWLENPDLQFISAHLHQAFYYKNYLCTGSVRATSPLEENDLKGFFSSTGDHFHFYENGVNVYFSLPSSPQSEQSPLSLADLQAHHATLQTQMKTNLSGLEVDYHFLPSLDLKSVSLSLRVDELNYQKMEQYVAPELQNQLSDVKLKKQQANVDDLLEKLQKPDSSPLKEGFGWRIDLLKRFLLKQYPDSYQEYEKLLQELKLV